MKKTFGRRVQLRCAAGFPSFSFSVKFCQARPQNAKPCSGPIVRQSSLSRSLSWCVTDTSTDWPSPQWPPFSGSRPATGSGPFRRCSSRPSSSGSSEIPTAPSLQSADSSSRPPTAKSLKSPASPLPKAIASASAFFSASSTSTSTVPPSRASSARSAIARANTSTP